MTDNFYSEILPKKFWNFVLPVLGLVFLLTLNSCKGGMETAVPPADESDFTFGEIDSNYTTSDLLLPSRFHYQVLFNRGNLVLTAEGLEFPSKSKFDFLAFLPIQGDLNHGFLWVNHECGIYNESLGSGGGATMLEIVRNPLGWEVLNKFHVDFSGVGETPRSATGPGWCRTSCQRGKQRSPYLAAGR